MIFAICSGLMFFICSAITLACSSLRFIPADLDMAARVSGEMSFIMLDTIWRRVATNPGAKPCQDPEDGALISASCE